MNEQATSKLQFSSVYKMIRGTAVQNPSYGKRFVQNNFCILN